MPDMHAALQQLFAELVDGPVERGGAYILNSGDIGMLRSLDTLSAEDASHASNGGASIAAHAQHVRYGLSLMNQWAGEGGNPFANAKWDEAWKTSTVNEPQWEEVRHGLAGEAHRWLGTIGSGRELSQQELTGIIASVGHLAYHLGAIRQIDKDARGPKEGTF